MMAGWSWVWLKTMGAREWRKEAEDKKSLMEDLYGSEDSTRIVAHIPGHDIEQEAKLIRAAYSLRKCVYLTKRNKQTNSDRISGRKVRL